MFQVFNCQSNNIIHALWCRAASCNYYHSDNVIFFSLNVSVPLSPPIWLFFRVSTSQSPSPSLSHAHKLSHSSFLSPSLIFCLSLSSLSLSVSRSLSLIFCLSQSHSTILRTHIIRVAVTNLHSPDYKLQSHILL